MPLPQSHATADDYWNLPENRRAELIDGELWDLAAPSRKHQRIVLSLGRRLEEYIEAHEGSCEVNVAPFAVNLFADDTTILEPDVSVVCDRNKLSDRGCEGAPDMVVEVVSPSNPEMDYLSKLSLYREAGVREYWICDPQRERTLVYCFDDESLLSIYPFAAPVSSVLFPGFQMDFAQVVASM